MTYIENHRMIQQTTEWKKNKAYHSPLLLQAAPEA
jgi:hypothetical protein